MKFLSMSYNGWKELKKMFINEHCSLNSHQKDLKFDLNVFFGHKNTQTWHLISFFLLKFKWN